MNNLTRRMNGSRPLTTWDLFREMDQVFNQLAGADWSRENAGPLSEGHVIRPSTDIRENEKGYLLAFDMPGVGDKDVKIEVKEGILTVTGERKREQSAKSEGWTRSERSYGKYMRSFSIPQDVDPAKIEAQVENGELHLFLPKGEAARPISIPVKTRATENTGEVKGLMERFFASKDVGAAADGSKH